MSIYRAAIIGCGRPRKAEGATGFGMAHYHMQGYRQAGVDVAAVADIKADCGECFAQEYGIGRTYLDYREMLAKEKPDIVSVCVWPKLHAEMTIAAAEAGVKAVHCEKPMAPTFGEARAMYEACRTRGVQLTFNHQRRFLEPFQKARELLRSGRIGKLRRIEASCGNFHDWGTHWIDMMGFFNGESPARWILANIDARDSREVFGLLHESQGISHIKFENGVHGLLVTGYEAEWEADFRLIGDAGVIELAPKAPEAAGVHLRAWSRGTPDWESIPSSENLHDDKAHARGVVDLVDALRTGREPELSSHRAFRATQIIFGSYESARRRGRVDLPLNIDDHPLIELAAAAAR